MSDSPQPKASLEIPDLELEPAPRALGKAVLPSSTPKPERPMQGPQEYGYSVPHLFDEDAFAGQSLRLDLDQGPREPALGSGGLSQFESSGDFELEPVGLADLAAVVGRTQASDSERLEYTPGAAAAWPSGRALDPTQIKIDPLELATVAGYPESPEAIQLSPVYAFRVIARQRELKREWLRISAESERAEREREAALGELSRVVRPAAETIESLRRFFVPILELERLRSEPEQAADSIHAERGTPAELRKALAELGRAVLAAGGSVEVPDHWLGRVRALSERADPLVARRELLRRAIDAYDRGRVRQGIRLTGTLVGLIVLLIGLKLAL
jgi:hypothetical protein